MRSRGREIVELYKQLNANLGCLIDIKKSYAEATKRLKSYEDRMLKGPKSVLGLDEVRKELVFLERIRDRKELEISKLQERISSLEQIREAYAKRNAK